MAAKADRGSIRIFLASGELQVITPPWLDFRMVKTPETLRRRIVDSLSTAMARASRFGGRPRFRNGIRPYGFVDREVAGPYALWNHEHRFLGSEWRHNDARSRHLCASFRMVG